MTTLTSRKAARAQLKSVLKAGVETAFSAVSLTLAAYASEPKVIDTSPALVVHSDGSQPVLVDYARELHRFWVTTYWLRNDPDTTEDNIDDLHVAVLQTLLDNAELAGYWTDLIFEDDFSEAAYVLINGVQWRTERLRVTVFSVCDNS